MMQLDTDPSQGVSGSLRTLADILTEQRPDKGDRDPRLELFMSGLIQAIDHLETATVGALALQLEQREAPKERLAYTLREVSELVPVTYAHCLKAAQNYGLPAAKRGGRSRGPWLTTRDAVVVWVAEGCPTHMRHPGGVSEGSRIYKEWIAKRERLLQQIPLQAVN